MSVFTGFAKRAEKKQFIQVGLLKQLCFLPIAIYTVRSELHDGFIRLPGRVVVIPGARGRRGLLSEEEPR